MTAERHVYKFGEYRLDPAERLLLRAGEPVPLAPKAFDMLVVLVKHSGHLLSKDQLMQEVWPDAFVEEVNLSVNISALRKVLGHGEGSDTFIDTVPRRGYRFTAPVTEVDDDGAELVVHNRIRARIVSTEVEGTAAPSVNAAKPSLISTNLRGRRLIPVVALVAALMLFLGLAYRYYTRARNSVVATPPAVNSVAVLPFKSLSPTNDSQYLELGLADELINKLSALKHLVIRPTSAVRRYAAAEQDPIGAGRELKVDAVLEGSIQESGDRIRITARLINIPDGRSLWSGTFDEHLKDMFTVEDSISTRVAEAVAPQLSPSERALINKHDSSNAEAHQLYLRGRYFWNKRSEEGIRKAIESFQQATALDPNYSLAYSGLADCYMSLYDFQFLPPGEAVPKAMSAAQKALQIDNTLADAHASVARLSWLYDHDRQNAAREFNEAIALNPNYATARQWHSRFLADLGQYDEAIGEMKKAEQLDPLSVAISSNLGLVLYYSRQYDQATRQLQQTIEMDPEFELSHWLLGNTFERRKMYPEAISEYERALIIEGAAPQAAKITAAFKTSGFDRAIRILCDIFKQEQGANWGLSYSIARYSAVIGDDKQALEWLEKARAEHHPWLTQLSIDPQFDSLKSDPNFVALLQAERLAE
jgi:DNA-binding winged helix-turn-helix (wHTH) protein/TolB-like protein/predicted negative regulator of RcsB-dependent stress response